MFMAHVSACLFLACFIIAVGCASLGFPLFFVGGILLFGVVMVFGFAFRRVPFAPVLAVILAVTFGYCSVDTRIPEYRVNGQYQWQAQVLSKQSKQTYDKLILVDSMALRFAVSVHAPSPYMPGDTIDGHCDMAYIPLRTEDPYERVNIGHGVFHACRFGSAVIFRHEKEPTMFARIADLVTKRFRYALKEPYSSVVVAIVTGDGSRIPEDILRDFTNSGLRHIIVVSGMHLAILGNVLMHSAILLGVHRQHALWGVILMLCLFVGVIGAPVSAVRGLCMAAITLLVQYAGRQRHAYMVLLLACAGMLVVNPFFLVFNVGFQLSFLATIAIVYGAPVWVRIFKSFIPYSIISQTLGVSTAAYLGTIPISAYYFGEISVTAIIANLIVVPVVPFIYGLSAVVLLVDPYIPLISRMLGAGIDLVLTIVRVIGTVSTINLRLTIWLVVLMYVGLGIGLVLSQRKEKTYEW